MGFLHHQGEVERSIASGEIEFRISRPDGSIRWIAHVCHPALDAQGILLGRRGSNRDITEQKQGEEALRISERGLRALSAQLMMAQETERRRISRELHDDLGGTLAVLKLRSSRMNRYLTGEPVEIQDEFRENLRTIDQLIDDVRRISRDLSPSIIEDLGLTSALKRLMNDFVRDYRIPLACDLTELDGGIPLPAQVMIYRIFQEILTNIGKHAQAGNVTIRVGVESGELVSVVEDDGKGFDHKLVEAKVPAERGMGLTTMKERARLLGGSLELKSEIGHGTRIALRIPIDRRDPR
jgi:signal transduction histidine kinase